jgi:TolB-like protein/predicted Zn-dependent protease
MGARTSLSPEGLQDSLRSLRRRRLYKVAAGYGVIAWLAVQIADVLFPVLLMPEWGVRLVLSLALLGLPIALLFAWLIGGGADGEAAPETRPGPGHSRARYGLHAVMLVLAVIAGGLLLTDAIPDKRAPGVLSTVAVLPFSDLSRSGDSQYLGDGIAGELLSSLGRLEGLSVAARTSSFAFRGDAFDARRIGDELNVQAVVQGSLRRAGDELKINVQVIETRDGFNVWSRSYSRQISDILELQEEIANAIVTALSVEVLGTGAGQLSRRTTDSAEAYRHYLAGRYDFHRRTPASLARAVSRFEEALEHDPDFALAYTGLADANLLLVSYGNQSPEQGRQQAEAALSRALALDDRLGEAYASLGLLRAHSGERLAAEQAYRHAISLNPEYSMAYMWLGNLLNGEGRLREAIQAFRRARELDPLHPVISTNLGGALMSIGDYDGGMALFESALERSPDSDTLLRQMSKWAGHYGQLTDMMRYADAALAAAPDGPMNLLAQARAWQWLGEAEIAQSWLERAEDRGQDNVMVFYGRASFYLEAGRPAELASLAEAALAASPPASSGTYADRMRLMWAGIGRVLLHDYDGGANLLERALVSDEARRSREDLPALTYLAMAYRQSARESEADRVLAQCRTIIEQARDEGMDDPRLDIFAAVVDAQSGAPSAALEALTRAVDRGWTRYSLIENHRAFDELRRTLRFTELMQRLRRQVALMRREYRPADQAALPGAVGAPVEAALDLQSNTIRKSRETG